MELRSRRVSTRLQAQREADDASSSPSTRPRTAARSSSPSRAKQASKSKKEVKVSPGGGEKGSALIPVTLPPAPRSASATPRLPAHDGGPCCHHSSQPHLFSLPERDAGPGEVLASDATDMAGWDLLWIKFALDNPYLRNGFRPMPNYSLSACFRSVFTIHNETANIWTHAGAGILFAAYWWTLVPRLSAMGGGELEFWTCFFVSTILMLFASATYHTCRCHSHEMFDRTLMLDLSGIASVIGAQCIVTVRYLMWCHPEAQSWLYLFVTILIAFNMLIIPIIMRYNLTNFRTFAFCLYACTPMGVEFAAAFMEGRPLMSVLQTPTCQEQLIVYGLCTTALSIRGYKAPERWYPDGRFDLLGASHQIFHVVIAYAVYYFTSTYVELSLDGYFHERCKVL